MVHCGFLDVQSIYMKFWAWVGFYKITFRNSNLYSQISVSTTVNCIVPDTHQGLWCHYYCVWFPMPEIDLSIITQEILPKTTPQVQNIIEMNCTHKDTAIAMHLHAVKYEETDCTIASNRVFLQFLVRQDPCIIYSLLHTVCVSRL